LADSNDDSAAQKAGASAELAANIKSSKYSVLSLYYLFQPVTVENAGDISMSAINFLNQYAAF